MRLIPHTALLSFCQSCFQKLGLSPEDAELTARNLVFANLRGIDSHGVVRMKIYSQRLKAGGVNPRAEIRVIEESPTTVLLDAQNGMGQVAACEAMKAALLKASESGLGWVGVRNSNHFGAAAFYAMMALEQDMIGLALTNSGPTMAPTGGREARLGNNPIGIAVPAFRHPPVVLDMATGAVAWGKIFMAQKEGKKIPLSWALDKNGLPTDDPNAAAHEGLIQPVGGYKGYGLSLMVDILTGVLSGSGFSTGVNYMYRELARPTRLAHVCAALRIDTFTPAAEFRQHVDQIIDLMHACPLGPGTERIYVPGEIEQETEQERRAKGIPLAAALEEELKALGAELGVDLLEE